MSGAEIALGVAEAVMGAVELTQGILNDTAGGFTTEADGGSYPKELEGFLKKGTLVNREVLTFKANGYVWNTDLGLGMRGSFSDNNDELMCFEDHPGIPSNRYMTNVEFYESAHSDTVSQTLLDLKVKGYDQPYGDAENPYLVFHVSGHFDPVGIGDERFSFNLYIDSYGMVSSSEHDASEGLTITDTGTTVEIYINQ